MQAEPNTPTLRGSPLARGAVSGSGLDRATKENGLRLIMALYNALQLHCEYRMCIQQYNTMHARAYIQAQAMQTEVRACVSPEFATRREIGGEERQQSHKVRAWRSCGATNGLKWTGPLNLAHPYGLTIPIQSDPRAGRATHPTQPTPDRI